MIAPERASEHTVRVLYATHGAAIRGFALRALGDPQLAEDVLQEVLMRAWSRPDVLEPDSGPVRGWLLTVARNVIIDAHRRRSARPQEVAFDVSFEPGLDLGELNQTLDSLVLADALGQLSAEHREVLVELYLRDRSVAETAAVLKLPVGTVKSRTFYGLKALRGQLNRAEVLP